MSTRQSAIINGLIAENIGKNDLVRSADSRASEAELRAKKSEYAASDLSYQNALLEAEKKKLQEENKMFRELLSRPMREIAEVSGDFRSSFLRAGTDLDCYLHFKCILRIGNVAQELTSSTKILTYSASTETGSYWESFLLVGGLVALSCAHITKKCCFVVRCNLQPAIY